ncbi:peptidoglycan editing factor PgeF [Dyadobacter aurulentus]|uniref:peptidoglycan editing factor PgeF n=1 Tax=Dyadobacter sp. UC 10 TaxID=2605428 RepID=UPI0011F1FE8D|nr:peptidoglycan editing factor PgeF [Dyadobacter sp. UC 10]KAA0989652.1 peptidoglycan editing factor PgeF [Dyadobacter sp. UC 10]
MTDQATSGKKPLFRRPAIFTRFDHLIAAESTRHGGISPAPFASLNLGGSQDSRENILANNHIFFSALGVPFPQVAKSHQVHGREIIDVKTPGRFEGFDALITGIPGIQLAVTVADCTPILIFDPVKNASAAIHAGWRGTVSQIASRTMAEMQNAFGTDPKSCLAYIGTCIDKCSFEVGEDVAQHFEAGTKRWDAEKEKYFVDLKKANREQLAAAGLLPKNIETSPYSTVLNNEDYFSYRFENGMTGRLLATIGYFPDL